jgi:hypothetical protein
MPLDARTWIERFSEALDTPAPSDADVDLLLQLAGVAAHASERTAAPVSCWVAARAGADPSRALTVARELAAASGSAADDDE